MPSNFNNQELTEIKFNGVDVTEAYFNGALVFDANQFVSTWRTTTANETIYIPTSTFVYDIDWGDGTVTNNTNFHEYAIAGDYVIKIRGSITDFAFNNTGDKDKILEVSNFGGASFGVSSFYGCSNLDVIDLKGINTKVGSIGSLFRDCTSLVYNSSINLINAENASGINSIFRGCTNFNQPLNFDASNATLAQDFLRDATNFNSLVTVNLSSATNTNGFFADCMSYNQNINLNTPSSKNFGSFLLGCSSFNSEVNIDTSISETLDNMFTGCTLFNQPLNFDTSNVTNMSSMFNSCSNFNQPLNFDTSNVTNMSGVFNKATNFNSSVIFSNTSNVISMSSMFFTASNFNQPLNFDTSNVTNMSTMFRQATLFNQPLNFDTSIVTNMFQMFRQASSFNQPLDSWSFVSVTRMDNFMANKSTEYNAVYFSDLLIKLDQDLVFANMTNVNLGFGTIKYDYTGVAAYNSLVSKGFIIQSGGLLQEFVSTWRTTTSSETITLPTPTNYEVDWGDGTSTTNANSHVYAIAGDYQIKIGGDITDFAFNNGGGKDKILNVSSFGGIELINGCFNGCSNLDVTATDEPVLLGLSTAFFDCLKLEFNNSIYSWDTSSITSMNRTFRDCQIFNQAINWNTSSVTSMNSMFYRAFEFNQPLSFDTSNVNDMALMFSAATNFNQPLTFDTSEVLYMNTMFSNCGELNSSINFTDTSKVTNMATMFYLCGKFNQPLDFDTSNVTNMSLMFRQATNFNQPLDFDTSNVTNMNSMFQLATNFNQDISSWSFVSVVNIDRFMRSKSDANYNANYLSDLLIKLDQDLVFANMVNANLGFGTIKYDATGVTAYNSLISKGFIIQSGGQV